MTQNSDVYKSNALIEASYRLTPAEQRIVLACITQVRRNKPITDDVLYSVSAADISSITGSKHHGVYDDLAKAALRLKRREVWITERPNGAGSHEETLITGWVQSIRYRKTEGRVELRFTKDMLPYLTQLTEQFTRYALSDVASMSSSHAIRLYELLCQWRGVQRREVSISWLREAFQLDGKYPLFYELKRCVVQPAVNQINEHSPLWVKWEQKKKGRKVTHLIFTFGNKEKSNNEKSKTKISSKEKVKPRALYGISIDVIEKFSDPGESYEDTAIRLLEKANKK